jgi:biopolymer transport protein TolR
MEPGSRRKRLMGEINVVPLIDVMLVLLVIFMATAPLLTQGVKVDLPKATSEPITSKQSQPALVVSIDQQARVFLNRGSRQDQAITDEQLRAALGDALRQAPELDVLIKADTRVAYGRVIGVMVVMQGAGARKVGFLTEPADVNAGRRP